MGFWDFLQNVGRAPVADPNVSYAMFEPRVEYLGSLEWEERIREQINDVRGMNAAQMWRTQPQLRTVVGFVARNIAQLGVHVFERVNETDRRRNRDNPFSRALANPGDNMTTYDMIFALVGDKMLYDRAYWLPWMDKQGNPRIRRLPPSWVSPKDRNAFGIETYTVTYPGGTTQIPAEKLLAFTGYSPSSVTGCSPPVEALKDTLVEMIQSTLYRAQVWKRGGRVSSVITRPANAPKWSDEAAERFHDDWYASYTGDGDRAGGTPILEDGMTINKLDLSAEQQQWAEGVKLSLVTVAGVYYVNPTMIGVLDNANYANVREFRRALYGDTLGPYIADLEGRFNTFALPFFNVDPDTFYAEFNIAEKLQGSFEEQAQVLSTATGRPWMTADEARAKQNMPARGGDADELVVPLNVLVGGQASPTDSGSQNQDPSGANPDQPKDGNYWVAQGSEFVHTKTRAPETAEQKAEQVVRDFFKRQEQVVRSKLGTKDAADWWDEDRWNAELSDDLYALAMMITSQVSAKTLEGIGFSPDEYDSERTLAWLREVSDRSASSLNDETKTRLQEALSSDSPSEKVDSVFASQESRATMVAVSTVTLLSGFAAVEATKQVAGDRAKKTWVVTSKNPRPEHRVLNGETVALDEKFSNGAMWPGDGSALGPSDLSNCRCELEISVGRH